MTEWILPSLRRCWSGSVVLGLVETEPDLDDSFSPKAAGLWFAWSRAFG